MFFPKLLSLITLIFIVSIANAQTFEGGLLLGLATSQVSGDNLAGFNKPGLLAGGFTATPLGKKFKMQFELKFIQKGSWAKNGQLNNYKLNLNYIDAPFLLKYPFKKFVFETGLSLGALVSHRERSNSGNSIDPRNFNRFELAGIFGVDYKFSDHITFNAKYNNSLLPIREHMGTALYIWNLGQYNTVLEFSLHYKIKRAKN